MNNQAFDDQIRRAVENIDTNYKPETWDLLEQRLNNTILPQADAVESSAEEAFDDIIRKKMANKTPAYNPNHWIIMSSLLDEYQSVRAWLVRYRVLESALTILFVLTFINVFYIPAQYSNSNTVISQNAKVPSVFKNELEMPAKAAQNLKFVVPSPIKHIQILKNTEQKTAVLEKRVEEKTVLLDVAEARVVKPLEQVQFLPKLAIPFIKNNSDNALIISTVNSKKSRLKYRIGLAMGSDVDRIFTPDFYSYGTLIAAFSQTRYNFNAGFLTDLKKNRWAFETGLLYTKKSYSPVEIRQDVTDPNISTAAYKENLATIKVNIVQLPTMLHFDFLQRKRWDLFLVAGATTNFITQAKYDYSRQFIGYVSRPVAPSATVEPPVKIFNDGIFITKSTIGNVFFTANVGLGATYRLTPKFNVYSQMIYRSHLSAKGIGPNEDKINTTSLLVGFKKAF
jgi:Outer membrane protein beta-barrel domain